MLHNIREASFGLGPGTMLIHQCFVFSLTDRLLMFWGVKE